MGTRSVRSVPEGYHAVTPFVIVKGAARFLDFMRDAFGAEELGRVEARMARSVTPRQGSAIRW